MNAFDFGWSSYRKGSKSRGVISDDTLFLQMPLWCLKMPESQLSDLQTCSLDSGLETTLSLLSKASVARSTWGSLCTVAASTLLVMYILEWQSVHFAFTYGLPILKSSVQVRDCIHTGGQPQAGWLVPLCIVQNTRTSSGCSGQGRDLLEPTNGKGCQMGRTFADKCILYMIKILR